MILMEWFGFHFFYSYYKLWQEEFTNPVYLSDMMLLFYVHNITIRQLYYKDANGKMLAVVSKSKDFRYP